jgi:hypothetical protein
MRVPEYRCFQKVSSRQLAGLSLCLYISARNTDHGRVHLCILALCLERAIRHPVQGPDIDVIENKPRSGVGTTISAVVDVVLDHRVSFDQRPSAAVYHLPSLLLGQKHLWYN